MASITYAANVTGAGLSFASNVVRSANHGASLEYTLPAGEAGALTTRTDDGTGELTLSPDHGITTGQVVDLYWSGGVRYAMTVGTVVGTAVPLSGGSGDVLPAAATAIVVSVRVNFFTIINLDGPSLSILACQAEFASSSATDQVTARFHDRSDYQILDLALAPNVVRVYDISGGEDDPFGGTAIELLYASNASSENEATLHLLYAQDATWTM